VISKRRHFDARASFILVLLAVVALAGAASLAGCGADDEGGGEITVSPAAEPHDLDPAFAYHGEGARAVAANEAMSLVYTPLLAYRREEGLAGAELIPGLAQDLPEISEDGRTYTLTLREGLEYSNGTTVRARDFEHAVKRVLTAGTRAASLLERIDGADEYLVAGDPEGDLRGIRSDDETGEIVIELTEPDASFSNVLAMWFAAPVPRNTSFRNRSADPPPGVGPYEITESEPGRRFVLEKSEAFPQLALPDIPTGNVDRITTEIVNGIERQAQNVLEGRLDYMREPPPEDVRSSLLAEGDERYGERPGPGTVFVYFTPRTPPFDDPRVREAVSYAIDRPALADLFDGELEPGCSFLPPGIPGYDEAFDTIECPYGDPSQPPDIERGRRLIEAAGAAGAEVTVWRSDEAGIDEMADAYAETLRALGLEVALASADRGTVVPAPPGPTDGAQTGVADWLEDFPHPLSLYSRLVGEAVDATGGAALGDARIAREVERLNLETDLASVAEEWAALDRYLVSPPQSYVAPIGHPKLTRLLSERLDVGRARFHPVYLNDQLRFALEEGSL
jgi:peptide/nickel transport system substrate-binding protein